MQMAPSRGKRVPKILTGRFGVGRKYTLFDMFFPDFPDLLQITALDTLTALSCKVAVKADALWAVSFIVLSAGVFKTQTQENKGKGFTF